MRQSEIVVVPSGFGRGRDNGKTFRITEWPAATAESWAVRALLAFNRGGTDFPGVEAVVGRGMEAVVAIGIQSFLRGRVQGEEVVPILDELFDCVAIIRDPRARDQVTGAEIATPLLADDIEEIPTRMWLRSEVLRVHTGFSMADALSSLISAVMTGASASSTT